jgi:cytochrome b involved in lipid metabolism
MKTKSILALLALIIALGGGWYFMNFEKYAPTKYVTNTPTGTVTTDTTTGTTSTGTPTFSMTDVAAHKDASSCYSIVSGAVYDLTMWVNMHPGGKGPILSMCGTDGTQAFMNQHHGAPKQMAILARYQIGVLTQ